MIKVGQVRLTESLGQGAAGETAKRRFKQRSKHMIGSCL